MSSSFYIRNPYFKHLNGDLGPVSFFDQSSLFFIIFVDSFIHPFIFRDLYNYLYIYIIILRDFYSFLAIVYAIQLMHNSVNVSLFVLFCLHNNRLPLGNINPILILKFIYKLLSKCIITQLNMYRCTVLCTLKICIHSKLYNCFLTSSKCLKVFYTYFDV